MKRISVTHNALMIALALVVVFLIPGQVPQIKTTDILGPRFIPYLGCLIVVVPNLLQMIIHLIRNAHTAKRSEAERSKKEREPVGRQAIKVGVTFLLALAATYAAEAFGFVITFSLLCCCMLVLFGEKRWYYYVISCVLVYLIFLGFTKALYVPLPTLWGWI